MIFDLLGFPSGTGRQLFARVMKILYSPGEWSALALKGLQEASLSSYLMRLVRSSDTKGHSINSLEMYTHQCLPTAASSTLDFSMTHSSSDFTVGSFSATCAYYYG